MRPIPDAAVDFVANHEGCKLTAYQDIASVWTIGFGHTGNVQGGTKISREEARELLRGDLKTAAARLQTKVKREVIDALTDNQYAALLSFVFNLGTPKATLWSRLNARQFDQVPLEMMKFINAGGRPVQGLVNRRSDEVKLWHDGAPATAQERLPSSMTRTEPTPATPADPTPTSRSAMLLTSAAGAVAAGPPMVNQAIQSIQPYAEQSAWVKHMLGILAAIGACLAVAGIVLIVLNKRSARR